MLRLLLILLICLLGSCVSTAPQLPPAEFVHVPIGEFTMGTDDCRPENGPAHRVRVGTFFMFPTEFTTQAAAQLLTMALAEGRIAVDEKEIRHARSGDLLLSLWDSGYSGHPPVLEYQVTDKGDSIVAFAGRGNHPVRNITWYGAAFLCNQFSRANGYPPAYNEDSWKLRRDKGIIRLPTEAEWEYASKEGPSDSCYLFSGSDTVTEVGWCGTNAGQDSHGVALLVPNALELYDLSGNVSEWCHNSYYPYDDRKEPHSPYKVIRGGHWLYPSKPCENTFRCKIFPGNEDVKIGFRPVYIPI